MKSRQTTRDTHGRRSEHSRRDPDQAGETSSDRLYGLIPVLEALRAHNRRIEQITIADGARDARIKELMDLARQSGVPVHRVPRFDLDRALGNTNHQGVFARTAAVQYHDADELLDVLSNKVSHGESPIALGLDGIEDPRNLGAIVRTAECAGVDGIFVPERRAVGLTDTVAKTAAGALEHIPISRVTNLVRLIEQLKERNIWVVGTAENAQTGYTEWDWKLPVAIFLGNEGSGLHRLVRERCDTLVRIPVLGNVESLNVSVATGILLYEALRQRNRVSR